MTIRRQVTLSGDAMTMLSASTYEEDPSGTTANGSVIIVSKNRGLSSKARNGRSRPSSDTKIRRRSEGDLLARYDEPVHEAQDSLFSTSSGYTNYRGLLNLCIILLVLSNARLAVENLLKYGILVDPFFVISIFFSEPYHWPNATLVVFSSIFVFVALGIELSLAKGQVAERSGFLLHSMNCTVVLVLPVVVILAVKPNPAASCICLMIYAVLFLKLVSYAQVNSWCRTAVGTEVTRRLLLSGNNGRQTYYNAPKVKKIDELTVYPFNLNKDDVFYFMLAPTLCYELNFPRSRRFRKWFAIKRFGELVFLSQLIMALSQQWIVPLLKNAVEPLIYMELGRVVERLLKLAIPNHVLWLMFFYCIFHSYLNFIAELLRFADRVFYKDWWNAESIGYFWRNWNIPVHRWCARHCFRPLVTAGMPKRRAAFVVFLVSAFFHEYLVSVPLGIFRLYAFGGMLAQIPLQTLIGNGKLFRGKYANMAVWMSIILGQPLAILCYLHDWYVINHVDRP